MLKMNEAKLSKMTFHSTRHPLHPQSTPTPAWIWLDMHIITSETNKDAYRRLQPYRSSTFKYTFNLPIGNVRWATY